MVNDYLRDSCDDNPPDAFSAKDFRTWGATVHAAVALVNTPLPRQETQRRSTLHALVKEVAALLENTPAVCRASYIHPRVLEGWLDGSLQSRIPATAALHPRQMERYTLRFLKRTMRTARGH
jgi:DNA topoisomerase-1